MNEEERIALKERVLVNCSSGYAEYDVETMISKDRIIWLHGSVQDETVRNLINKLLYLDSQSHDEITIFIKSPGGAIQDGVSVCDIISIIHSPVRTIAVGLVASMAAVIFAAGKKGRRFMLPSSKLMIHEPLISNTGRVNVSQIIKLGESMTETKTKVNKLLSDYTGKSIDEINEDTNEDKYFTAVEAIAYGLADEILTSENYIN